MTTMISPIRVGLDLSFSRAFPFPEQYVYWAAEQSLTECCHWMLFGPKQRIHRALLNVSYLPEYLSVVHAPHALSHALPPFETLGFRPHAGIARATQALGENRIDVLLSETPPHWVISAAKLHVPLIPGIRRAALAAFIPTMAQEAQRAFSLILDVGATMHLDTGHWLDFAALGAAYVRLVLEKERPKIALLTHTPYEPAISPPIALAHHYLSQMKANSNWQYIGFVEGHHIVQGEADLILTQGFTGNVLVRLLQGIAENTLLLAKEAQHQKLKWKLGLSMLSEGLDQLRKLMRWEFYGGAPLLGFQYPIFLMPAQSSHQAFLNTLKRALKSVRRRIFEQISNSWMHDALHDPSH